MKKWLILLLLITQAYAIADTTTTTTPDMKLILPIAGITSGPKWAQLLLDALTAIDQHDHTVENGKKVPTAGIYIDNDLNMMDKRLVNVGNVMFDSKTSLFTNTSDTNLAYVYNGDLYYNNSNHDAVQITSGKSIVGAQGNISGLVSPAAVTYNGTTNTFSFTQSSGVTSSIAAGSYSLYDNVSGANSVTLKSPTSLASSYNITFPSSIPASTKILTLSSTGVMGDSYDLDGSTLEVSSSTIRIKDSGVTTAKILDGAVTSAKIATGTIAQVDLAARPTGFTVSAGGVAISGGTGSTTTITAPASGSTPQSVGALSVTISTTGRPVMILLQSATGNVSTDPSYIMPDIADVSINILRGSTIIGAYRQESNNKNININPIVDAVALGTYTYSVTVNSLSSSTPSVLIKNLKLVAYEL